MFRLVDNMKKYRN